MTEHATPPYASLPLPKPVPRLTFEERWARLDSIEQDFAVWVLGSLTTGELSWTEWERYADIAADLLPLYRSGAITMEELHALAIHETFVSTDE